MMQTKAANTLSLTPNSRDFLIIKSRTSEDLKINLLYLLKQIYNLKWPIFFIISFSLFTGVYFSSHLKPQYVTNIILKKPEKFLYLFPNIYNLIYMNNKESHYNPEFKLFLQFKNELKNAQNIEGFYKEKPFNQSLKNTVLVQEKPDGYIYLSLTSDNQEMSKNALLEYVSLIDNKVLFDYVQKQKKIGLNLIKIRNDKIKLLTEISPIKNADQIKRLEIEKANISAYLDHKLSIDKVNCFVFALPLETKIISRKATKNLIVLFSLLSGLAICLGIIIYKSNISELSIQELIKTT
ncbi:hypothetical protein [Legionella waltersii]|uniref:Polysaccharide chain length determinant N-terminal domain-containing protein n=1 Tax=Legionella waltersii TaxID=66969 RepID=A0A0W1ANE4_9GAMM|nr:hypothetical protein [Legionella waltersii]KTD82739.1 hypothetical protein Lwal_0217 [Legionella waltersii]SNV01017.1 Uncharacterised protein [Legionella waltersii]